MAQKWRTLLGGYFPSVEGWGAKNSWEADYSSRPPLADDVPAQALGIVVAHEWRKNGAKVAHFRESRTVVAVGCCTLPTHIAL